MKVTSKLRGVSSRLFDSINTASIEYSPTSCDSVARVVEFPKVWREGGKQYTVDYCYYSHNGSYSDNVIMRIPRGADYYTSGCNDTVEYY